jgi:hypothetical protein
MREKTPFKGSNRDPIGLEINEDGKAEQGERKTDSLIDESLPNCDIELDMEEIVVLPIDGVVIEGDEEEVKLLFYYYKPDRNNGEDDVIRCKCIAEFRASRSHFISIMKSLRNKEQKLIAHQGTQREWKSQEQLPMFI